MSIFQYCIKKLQKINKVMRRNEEAEIHLCYWCIYSDLVNRYGISVTHEHCYVLIIVIITFPHLWLITGFLTRVIRRVPHVVKELLTLPDYPRWEHLPFLSGVSVAQSLVLCVMFCRSLLVLLSFSFWSLYCLSFFGCLNIW